MSSAPGVTPSPPGREEGSADVPEVGAGASKMTHARPDLARWRQDEGRPVTAIEASAARSPTPPPAPRKTYGDAATTSC